MTAPAESRYASAVASLVQRMEPLFPGIGMVVVPPSQHALIAAQLAPRLGAQVAALDGQVAPTLGPLRVVVPGLPEDRQNAAHLLRALNGRRDFIRTRGALFVLLVSPFEIVQVQEHAPDTYSGRLFVEEVRFEPDVDVDPEAARASLARYYTERFGRLDLRGFIRSETEDVSFTVEEIYQELRAKPLQREGSPQELSERGEQSVLAWLKTIPRERPAVILAHPGSGKTFLLRWLALCMVNRRPEVDLGVASPLPVLVSMGAYAQAPQPLTLLEYAIASLLTAGQPAGHLLGSAVAAGQALFLLDGIDEGGDVAGRARAIEAIRKLQEQAPSCRIIATSRIAGYPPDALEAEHLFLSPLDEDGIRGFLRRWCELYAVTRRGSSDAVRAEGRREGELLALDALGNSSVRALAGNPLMLTVLAIVHRAGLRLPDHRVELYAHATRVLVERWNRVRSLSGIEAVQPLKAVDSVRLLGPLAVQMIGHGASSVSEPVLRRHLEEALAAGTLRGISGAGEVIALFRDAIGLLVELSPRVYGFVHLTLAEYFAAWELLRSDALEQLASDPERAYRAQHREVLLLAAGELGVLRADDRRLDRLVETLIASAAKRQGKPVREIPSLLVGLLADDPHLTTTTAQRLVDELVSRWWFRQPDGGISRDLFAVEEAIQLLAVRIVPGRLGRVVHDAVERVYGSGFPEDVFESLVRTALSTLWTTFFIFLEWTGIDHGPHLLRCASEGDVVHEAFENVDDLDIVEVRGATLRGQLRTSRFLDDRARSTGIPIEIEVFLRRLTDDGKYWRLIERQRLPWTTSSRIGEANPRTVILEVELTLQQPPGDVPLAGYVRLQPTSAAAAPAAPPTSAPASGRP